MTARMRLPTFFPISADSRPGSMVPPITVGLLVRVLAGWVFGMVTWGAWPNEPVAVTDVFVPAAGEDEDEDEDEAAGFDEPQPARTTQASRGMAMSARKRRMKKPQWWWMSAPSAYWLCWPRGDGAGPGGTTPLEPPGCPLR